MRTRLSLAALAVALVGTFLVPHSALGVGHHAAQRAKTQHFLIVSSSPSEKAPSWIVANGPIHALGKDKEIGNKDKFIFPKGTLTVRHKRMSHHGIQDKKTCYFTETESGTFKVTKGTGAYAGASGSGRYHLKVQAVACKHQKPKFFSVQIKAKGRLSL
jgi:hypothetical protein